MRQGLLTLAASGPPGRSSREHRIGLLYDARGAIATEYIVVVGVCAITLSAALAALGPPLIASYQSSRHTLIAPVP